MRTSKSATCCRALNAMMGRRCWPAIYVATSTPLLCGGLRLLSISPALPPLALVFDFNPRQISRTRTMTVKTGDSPGGRGGYDFISPLETPRVAQGVEMQTETFSINILLDATDEISDCNLQKVMRTKSRVLET